MGIYFCLHGPRATKFSAIWETDRNQILFYGSGGERFQKTQLAETSQLADAPRIGPGCGMNDPPRPAFGLDARAYVYIYT